MPNHAIRETKTKRVLRLSSDSLLLATTDGAVGDANILVLVVVLVAVSVVVLAGGDPQVAVARLLHGGILTGKVDGLALVAVVAAALGKSAGTGREGRADGSVLLDPVGERVLAVLDDAVMVVSITKHLGYVMTETYALLAS
jgi:hypothetical protein